MTPCLSCLEIKESVKEDFIDVDRGIHGIGVGMHTTLGHYLIAYVSRGAQVPESIVGVRILKKWTEPVKTLAISSRKYPTVQTLDSFVRPVSGGNSVSGWSQLLGGYVTGTVGMGFQTPDGKTMILSNNHVLAGIATVQRGGANVGAQLFQPGSYYGGSPGDTFANLYQWGPIDEKNVNKADWATGMVPDPASISDAVLGVGAPAVIADPVPALAVAKMGALSGLTKGTVIDVNASIDVDYEGLFTASFDDQTVIEGTGGPFAIPGDSGSVVLATVANRLVATGLIFSGSSSIAVANKMTIVQNAAGIGLPTQTLQQPGGGLALPATLTLVGALSAFLTRGALI